MNYDGTHTESPETIEGAYDSSWKELVKMFNGDMDTKELDYVHKLSGCITKMLEFLVGNNDLPPGWNIGRGFVQINSLKFCRRIRIPFCGNAFTDRKDVVNEWMQHYDANEEKRLLFLQPDKVRHLLTELMWRFQLEDGSGTKAIVVSKKENDIFGDDVFSDDASSVGSQFVRFIPIPEDVLQGKVTERDEAWFNGLIREKDGKKGALQLPNPVDASKVPLCNGKNCYEYKDITSMLENPKRMLWEKRAPYTEAHFERIVYVSDLIETDSLGAMDFELTGDVVGMDKEGFKKKFKEFIEKIRWKLRLIIELISNAEKTYAVQGKVYKNEYFCKESGSEVKYPALRAIIKQLNTSSSNDELNNVVRKVIQKVAVHFEMANGQIGNYWRGYQRHAYEVACTVGGIIDILWPEHRGMEELIRGMGPKLEHLNDTLAGQEVNGKSKEYPLFIRQLFRGLEREKDFFLLPQYRDHFIHSFYCFVLGLILMSVNNRAVPRKLDLLGVREYECAKILQKWFLVAMWHDIAYILEKGESIIEKYVLNYMNPTRKSGVLRWIPGLGGLMQVADLLEEIRAIARENVFTIESPEDSSIKSEDIVLAVAFDHVNHGIWSSLFVNHCLRTGKQYKEWGWKKSDRLEVCRAILPHHISDWEVGKFFKECGVAPEKAQKFNQTAKIDENSNAMGYLLSLCDTICQAGRVAPEWAGDNSAKMKINYKGIDVSNDILTVELNYVGRNKEELSKVSQDYYVRPLKFLGLTSTKDTDSDQKQNAMSFYKSTPMEDTGSDKKQSSCIRLIVCADAKDDQ